MSKRLLIVDDDPDIRQVLVDRLESYGYMVESAQNGVEALERLGASSYDGLLLDLHMPEMDGGEVLRRTQELYPSLPVVLITASASQLHLMKSRYHGAKGYLLKPIYQEALKQAVERWF